MASMMPDITGYLETLNNLQNGANWNIQSTGNNIDYGAGLAQAGNAFGVAGIGQEYQSGIDAAYQNAMGQWEQYGGGGANPGLDVLKQQAANQQGLTQTLEEQIAARGMNQGLGQQMAAAGIANNNTKMDQGRFLAAQDEQINQLKYEQQLKDQADGGGGGGGGGGGYGGGGGGYGGGGGGGRGGSGGDEFTEDDLSNMNTLEQPNTDYRKLANSRKGAFGDKGKRPKGVIVKEGGKNIERNGPGVRAPGVRGGAYGKGAQDFLYGAKGGAKGHVDPNLQNVDDVLKGQLAWIDRTRRGKDNKRGTKDDRSVGYSKRSLIGLANDVKGRVEKADTNLYKKIAAYNKLDRAWSDPETGMGGIETIYGPNTPDNPMAMSNPQDVADFETAAANRTAASRKQAEDKRVKDFIAKGKQQKQQQAEQMKQAAAAQAMTSQQNAQQAMFKKAADEQARKKWINQAQANNNQRYLEAAKNRVGGGRRQDTQKANLLRAAAFNQKMAARGSTRRRKGYAGKRPGKG